MSGVFQVQYESILLSLCDRKMLLSKNEQHLYRVQHLLPEKRVMLVTHYEHLRQFERDMKTKLTDTQTMYLWIAAYNMWLAYKDHDSLKFCVWMIGDLHYESTLASKIG